MKVRIHAAPLNLQGVQEVVRDGKPGEYVPIVRNWLLSGPKFSEFEGFSRFLERAEIMAKIRAEIRSERWAVVGGYTTRPVAAALKASLLAHGVYAVVHEADYGAFDTELLSDDSATLAFRPEHLLLCTGHHHIGDVPAPGASAESVEQLTTAALDYLKVRWQRVRQMTGAIVHQHTFAMPLLSATGRLDDKYPWGHRRFFRNLNEMLWQEDGREIRVVDVDAIQQRIGSDRWWNSRWYHVGKLPFNPEHIRDYAVYLHAHIAAVYGKSRKCLVVDLDDTLWGGIVGDEGVEGIVLGNGSAAGEEYLELCSYVKGLGRTGVILGVVSKNEPAIAESVFRQHNEISLSLTDFAAFKASWQAKSVSLKELVKDLNIGMDGVVYLDDNPAECEEVARACPEAIVLQIVPGTEGIAQSLETFRLFDRQDFTAEDEARTASYASMQILRREAGSEGDLSTFLSSLDMNGTFQAMKPSQITRTSQLFAKTNQFNLTQVKFTELELTEMVEHETMTCFVATLDDKFAKHGLVSALVTRGKQDATAEIVNWVMSCRVFNRTFEEFIMLHLSKALMAVGYRKVEAGFIETDRNRYIHSLFDRLQFGHPETYERGIRFSSDLSSEKSWSTFISAQETSVELV